ncbi:uncharacterized protein [Aegilops tauschii subsp. strangulata]|uniref:uncharacterized protein n=1 Tax=Aegilops tauschii subsp. strangulata TaxID=200361 RepID=UPI001ABC4D60|nr:uncharacterized protein LOC120976947 [Aegilops tauschii subsp. strangulata]
MMKRLPRLLLRRGRQASGDIQGVPEEIKKLLRSVSDSTMLVADKPLIQSDASNLMVYPLTTAPQPSSSNMELTITHLGPGAPSSSILAGVNFDEEIDPTLVPLTQRAKEVDGSVDCTKDLVFLGTMAVGLKDVQERYGQRWQEIQEEHSSVNLVDRQLRDKGNELHKWYQGQIQSLMWQLEKLAANEKKATARDNQLTEHEVLLNAKEKDILAREEALAAILHGKDNELEALVQECTKDLEDGHEKAIDLQIQDSVAKLKEVDDNLAATSNAKANLEAQVEKLEEDLAGSKKETKALKEEV